MLQSHQVHTRCTCRWDNILPREARHAHLRFCMTHASYKKDVTGTASASRVGGVEARVPCWEHPFSFSPGRRHSRHTTSTCATPKHVMLMQSAFDVLACSGPLSGSAIVGGTHWGVRSFTCYACYSHVSWFGLGLPLHIVERNTECRGFHLSERY